MTRLRLSAEFLVDLMVVSDPGFARRVLRHVIDDKGRFIDEARNDHRFKGIEGAWIRYASEGGSAYRVIYVKEGDLVTLYRTGLHKVEDHLAPMGDGASIVELASTATDDEKEGGGALDSMYGQLLSSTHRVSPWKAMHSMFHVRQREIYLVSPYLGEPLLESNGVLGRYLDKALEDGTCVVLITAPPTTQSQLAFYQRLDSRGVLVFFYDRLHAKLYYFDVDILSLPIHFKFVASLAILGSSNLTAAGFGIDCQPNEELCYQVPSARLSDAKAYIESLMHEALDFVSFCARRASTLPLGEPKK